VKALSGAVPPSYNRHTARFTDTVSAPRPEVAMNIITALVREQERERVEATAAALGLTVSVSGPAAAPLDPPATGTWRGSRYRVTSSPILRLEIPYWGFRVEDAAEEILHAATPDGSGHPPATVWVTTASWFGTSCAPATAAASRVEHPSFSPSS
jgi:hypothetical protein